MLTQNDFINIEKQATAIYENLELEIIEEIATRIANFGYANTVVTNNIQIAQEMGFLYQDIIRLVAEYNNTSYEKVQKIFEEAGVETIKKDDLIYKEAGLNPVPIKQSRPIMQMMSATIEKTTGNLQNLCMTTANTAQTQFYNAINLSYMEVSTGAKSYTQSFIDALKTIAQQGAIIEYPSGAKRSIESAVRMNIITGVNQTCGQLQELRANEVGWDLMEITAHSGARPSHAKWQGKIVSLSEKKGYLSKDDIGYGEATGFKGINCKHDWHPYYKDSTRSYTQKELEKWKNEKVTYNGKEYTKYDATQEQRKIERAIRQDKKELVAQQKLLTSNNKDINIEEVQAEIRNIKAREKDHKNMLDNFLDQTGFRKDYSRLVI